MNKLTQTLIIIALGTLIALESQRFYYAKVEHSVAPAYAPLQRCPAPIIPTVPPHGDNINDDNVVLPLEITL